MSDLSSIFPLIFFVLLIVFIFVVTPKLDRDRICKNIEQHGGKVIDINRVWGWGNRNDRAYEVSYVTASGQQVQETCRTSMTSGVYWINTHPPGLD